MAVKFDSMDVKDCNVLNKPVVFMKNAMKQKIIFFNGDNSSIAPTPSAVTKITSSDSAFRDIASRVNKVELFTYGVASVTGTMDRTLEVKYWLNSTKLIWITVRIYSSSVGGTLRRDYSIYEYTNGVMSYKIQEVKEQTPATSTLTLTVDIVPSTDDDTLLCARVNVGGNYRSIPLNNYGDLAVYPKLQIKQTQTSGGGAPSFEYQYKYYQFNAPSDGCVASYSSILLPNGYYKLAKDIRAGDTILGYRDEGFVADVVQKVYVSNSPTIYRVTLASGVQLYITKGHKVLSTNNKWVSINEGLEIGTMVCSAPCDSEVIRIESVNVVTDDMLYNFVTESGTFIADNVIVEAESPEVDGEPMIIDEEEDTHEET